MKFLTKNPNSDILKKKLTYNKNRENNKKLKLELLKEQKQFCAYTEKYIDGLDATEVEHFNSSLKYNDDYYNYYAVLRIANQYKKDSQYKDAKFFSSLFFQDEKQFKARIKFENNLYLAIDKNDKEANDLIDFLGFNNPILYKERHNYINRLKRIFDYSTKDEWISFFKENKEELSFITAIENELKIDLSEIIK